MKKTGIFVLAVLLAMPFAMAASPIRESKSIRADNCGIEQLFGNVVDTTSITHLNMWETIQNRSLNKIPAVYLQTAGEIITQFNTTDGGRHRVSIDWGTTALTTFDSNPMSTSYVVNARVMQDRVTSYMPLTVHIDKTIQTCTANNVWYGNPPSWQPVCTNKVTLSGDGVSLVFS